MDIAQGNTPAGRKPFWTRWRLGHTLATGVLALVLVGLFAAPARAHVHVFIGGVFGMPLPVYPYVAVYPYAPPYPYSYAAPYYPPYPAYGGYAVVRPPAVPPGAWARGHRAWRRGPSGQRIRVWVPTHLR
jgi:hypothetical protein